MTTNDQSRRDAAASNDQIGKVFVVFGQDVRRCLICDGVFTTQDAAAHAGTVCHPSEGNYGLEGENEYADW
jgi:hypothetical protein